MNSYLQFTGNWFIDAGIFGFVSLMEEIYGWTPKELNDYLIGEPEKIYYGYFPFAYLYKWILNKNLEVKQDLVQSLIEELKNKNFHNEKDIFDFVWYDFICRRLFKELWIETRCKLIYKDDAKDRNNKRKREKRGFIDSYLEKIEEREKVLKKLCKKYSDKLNDILNKKKKKISKDTKLNYDDVRKLLDNAANLSYKKGLEEELKNLIEELKNRQAQLQEFLNKEWEEFIKKKQNKSKNAQVQKDEEFFFRIPVDSSFYKNFSFFNTMLGNFEQKESFYNIISSNFTDELDKIDKTINKFLPSEEEFLNINYTRFSAKLLIENLKQLYPFTTYFFVFLLCFVYAFEDYGVMGKVFFYSPDLEFTYLINKRLKLYKNRIKDSNRFDEIFKITWEQIIDLLVEYKSSWCLENMYIISYQRLTNQEQVNVEYIGISKFQATILVDDILRKSLNVYIKFRDKKGQFSWLIKQFLSKKPIYPVILDHIWLGINGEIKYVNKTSSLYALCIDAHIRQMDNSELLFSNNFFNSYKWLVKEIKRDFRFSYFVMSTISNLFSEEEKSNISYELFSALKSKNKNLFINILLKHLNSKKDISNLDIVNSYLNDKILKNDISWEMFALSIIMGVVK